MGTVALALSLSLVFSRSGALARSIIYSAIALIFIVITFDLTQTILMAGLLDRDAFSEKVLEKRDAEGCTCWWPVWANKAALIDSNRVNASERNVEMAGSDALNREFRISPGPATISGLQHSIILIGRQLLTVFRRRYSPTRMEPLLSPSRRKERPSTSNSRNQRSI